MKVQRFNARFKLFINLPFFSHHFFFYPHLNHTLSWRLERKKHLPAVRLPVCVFTDLRLTKLIPVYCTELKIIRETSHFRETCHIRETSHFRETCHIRETSHFRETGHFMETCQLRETCHFLESDVTSPVCQKCSIQPSFLHCSMH